MRQILRQIVAVLALVGITSSMVPAAFAVTYTAQAAADKLAASNFIVDQSANPAAYRLADNLLRQEAVGVAANVRGVLTGTPSSYVCQNKFSDVTAASGWVCRAAELAAAAGITNAANATFRPKDNLTRYEALVFALRAADLITTNGLSQSALIQLGVDNGLITSAAGFNANAAATRGEFFQYVARGLDALENPLCDLFDVGCTTTTPNPGPNTSGSVSASLSAGQPSGLIVAGQATAELAKFSFTGNGTVNSVKLTRSGLSDQNTLSNVYLFDGAVRLTDGYSFNSNGVININNLGLAVNGSKVITVRADVAAATATGQTIAVALTGYTAAGASAATVNVQGPTLTTGSGSTLASVSFPSANATASATVNAGVSSYTVWSQSVQVNTRTVHLKAANFRMVGSAPSDALSNVKLYVDGVDTGKTASLSMANGSNYLMFDLMAAPIQLTTGSHTLEVRANIEKGSNRTIQVSIQQASDLMILDPQVGVNIAVTGTIPSAAGTLTINTGSATAVLDPTFQAQTNVTGGGSNTTIAKFKVRGYGEDVKVQTLTVLPSFPTSPTGVAGLDDVTVYFNGTQVGTQQDWTSGNLTFQLGSQMIVPAGQDSVLEVRANVRTTTGTNYTDGSVRATLVMGSSNAQGQNSLNTLNFPTANVVGNTLTIQTGLLSVSKNTAYANQTVSPNTAGVKIGSYVVQNQSTSESVRVTSLAVALTTDGTTAMSSLTTPALSNFSALRTSETSGSGGTPIQPQATNTFSVDFTLAPGTSRTIDILVDTSTTGGGATIVPTLSVTSIGAISNVSATSTALTGQTITLNTATFGTPTFTANASTNAQFIASGTTGVVDGAKYVFKLSATNGSTTVSELKFAVKNSSGVNAVSSVRVGSSSAPVVGGGTTTLGAAIANGAVTSITVASAAGIGEDTILLIGTEELRVTAVSGTTLTVVRGINGTTAASASNGATVTVYGTAYLTGLALAVPNAGSGLSIDVYPTYSNVGTNGIPSSSTSTLILSYAKHTSGSTTGTFTTSTSTYPVGNIMTLVGSKPTVTVAKPTGVVVAVGNIEAIDVTVTADAKGDITLNSLPITVGVGGASTTVSTSANTVIVTKADNSSITTTNTAFGAATGGSSTITFTGGFLIPAGTSQTFRVFVPVTAITAGVSGSTSLSTSLATGSGFGWTDTAGGGSALTGTSNIFGYPNTFTSTINN